jgi:hypothetical protein
MNPLLLLALGGGVLWLLNKKEEPRNLVPTGPGGTPVNPLLYQVPGYASLPAEVQSQINWVVQNGTKDQILSLAAYLEKLNPANKTLADALRTIAAQKG